MRVTAVAALRCVLLLLYNVHSRRLTIVAKNTILTDRVQGAKQILKTSAAVTVLT